MQSHLPQQHVKLYQSERDYKRVQERLQRNSTYIEFIENYFKNFISGKVNAVFMNEVARVIAERLNIHIDRLAKRYKTALLCWYAENWNQIAGVIDSAISQCLTAKCQLNTSPPVKQPLDPSDLRNLLNH